MIETNYTCPCLEARPLSKTMDVIGGKWKMQIICALNNCGPIRYNRLRKKLDGISNTILAKALKELESEGLVNRKEFMEVPVRVEYSTTSACDALIPILDQLGEWWESHAGVTKAGSTHAK